MSMVGLSSLNTVASDFTHVYFVSGQITNSNLKTKCGEPDFEFPVIADSIEYTAGDNHEEIKLVSGDTWAVKRSTDSSVQFNVAANNKELIALFSGAETVTETQGVKTKTSNLEFKVAGFNTANIKSITGGLILTDDNGHAEILPNVKLVASRGKDSLVYWTVKGTIMANSDGVDVYMTTNDGTTPTSGV